MELTQTSRPTFNTRAETQLTVIAAAARLEAHAPEYLIDPDTNQWYITTAGWPGTPFGTKIPGSVAIRELDWV